MNTLPAAAERFREDRRRLMARLERGAEGLAWCHEMAELADGLIREVFARVSGGIGPLAVLAVGGYGRSELAPYSDVDLLVIPEDDADPALDILIRNLHRELHAALGGQDGIALSYAMFLLNDAPALDPKTRTAMLDARCVAGSERAFERFRAAFRESLPVGEFLLEKIRERRDAEAKWNDTPLATEPNLKEGAGGLRSFHASNWLRQALGHQPASPPAAYEQLIVVRNLLHSVAGRPFEQFTRGRQAEIADRLGEDLSVFVSRIAEARWHLDRIYRRSLESVTGATFQIAPGVSSRGGVIEFGAEAPLSTVAVGCVVGHQLGLHIPDQLAGTGNDIDGPAALHAITNGEASLRALDRCGLLGRLLPELDRCRTLMPEDAVHAFSVFEHTLRTVRHIEAFPEESFYGRLRSGLSSIAPLVLAALLHDVGKADPGLPHSVAGAKIAREVAHRWELAPGIAATVEWLVLEHLTMARFIGMRDVSDPRTAAEFAKVVGTRERLDMLTILTCADVSAVARGAWSPAQEAFLRELHGRTSAVLETEMADSDDPTLHRRRLLRSLKDHPVPQEEVEAFLEKLPAHYVVNTAPALVPVHLELARHAAKGQISVVWDHDRDRRLSEVTVAAPDAPGLLSRILGVLYAFDLSVHAVRASTTTGVPAVALDTVLVSFGHQPAPQATCALVVRALQDILANKASLDDLLTSRGKDPLRRQEHLSFNYVEGSPGILEIQAPRGRGMAFRISKTLAAQGWNIVSARFGQWAGKGAAAFYILDADGGAVAYERVREALS